MCGFIFREWLDLFWMLVDSTSVSSFRQLTVCLLHPSCTAEVAAHPNHLGLVPSAEEAMRSWCDCTESYSKND